MSCSAMNDDKVDEEELTKESLLRMGIDAAGSEARLVIHSSTSSILGLHELMTNLRRLTLDGSSIFSLRDLGTRLGSITHLSVNDCGLSELDGAGAFPELIDLSASNNSITEASCLAMHACLQSLNLAGNCITTLAITDSLSTCPVLTRLRLTQNPIQRIANYALVVCALIPNLLSLDNSAVDPNRAPVPHSIILEAALALSLVEEELEEERRMEMAILQTEAATSSTGVSATGLDTGSELTYGSGAVLAGSASSLLRRRTRGGDNFIESPLAVLDRALASPPRSPGSSTVDDVTAFLSDVTRRPASSRPASSTRVSSPRQINSSRPQSSIRPSSANAFFTERAPLRIIEIDGDEDPGSIRQLGLLGRSLDDEESEGSGSDEEADRRNSIDATAGRRRNNPSDKAGAFLGFDLSGSLAAISDWARTLSESDESEEGGSPIPRTARRRTTEVLSRDAILSMCAGESVGDDRTEGRRSACAGRAGFDDCSQEDDADEEDDDDEDADESIEAGHMEGGDDKAGLKDGVDPMTYLREKKLDYSWCQRSESDATDDPGDLNAGGRLLGGFNSGGRLRRNVKKPLPLPEAAARESVVRGSACQMTDGQLVDMLKRPPKLVPELRTKSAFQGFFSGVPRERMQRLLETAYAGQDREEIRSKVQKRLDLLGSVLPSEPSWKGSDDKRLHII